MVFIRFEPVVPVNTGTSVTGIGCVTEIAGDFAWRQLPDADRQHTPWVSACDRGVLRPRYNSLRVI